MVNNKIYSATKMSLFMANYGREMRMVVDIRRKQKIKKAMEFTKRINKSQEEARAALGNAQKKMKWQADRGRKEVEEQKKGNKMILSTKDLMFKERLTKKLVDQYASLYIIDRVVSTNAIKLQVPTLMRIHLVVNISQVVRYREQMEKQKVEEVKPVEVDEVEE